MASTHLPVLVKEAIQGLAVRPGGRYVDCTIGGGGHAVAILEHSSPGGQLLGLDADPEAVSIARGRLETYRDAVLIANENFVRLRSVCDEYDFYPVHGILFDLGLSSLQLASNARGFSFQRESALDMRLSPEQETTAEDIVNTLTEDELANLLWTYGEEARSHRIARRIVEERPVRTTFQLARIVELAVGGRRGRIHPATKTFQALRIAVNRELQNLESVLEQAVGLLGFEGRLAVISYHSLEDRIVKRFMQRESRDCICPPGIPRCVCGHTASIRMVNRKVIRPSPDEVQLNPRSRSARLRVAERLAAREENQWTDSENIGGIPGFPDN
ncbi:MAG TPA: 16S rRNA (cytosine(1402)-N(4))-methyltransferase RsmH [Dehalococcoidales bacterium]|nr:16S rRNA (cytosine(1402)-N(4))-methyltransferase RsmH [Dehalococcoidales bacterium]